MWYALLSYVIYVHEKAVSHYLNDREWSFVAVGNRCLVTFDQCVVLCRY